MMAGQSFMKPIFRNSGSYVNRHSGRSISSNTGMGTIGSRIRAERRAQGISTREMEKAAELSRSGLNDLELGKSKTTPQLHLIAERLGVTVSWLATGRGPKHLTDQEADQTLTHDSRQARAVRPDPDILAEAYQAAVYYTQLVGQPDLKPSDLDDSAVICDLYAIRAAGGTVLTTEGIPSDVVPVIRQRAQRLGGANGQTDKARRGKSRTG